MRAGATIRKASAYLTSFDAPPPANDLDESSLPVMSLTEEGSPISADLSIVRKEASNETENAAEDAVRLQPDIPIPEGITAALEIKIAAAVEDERQAAAQNLQQARQEWTSEIAERLAIRLEQSIAEAIDRFREDVAGILKPYVTQEILARSIEGLTASVRKGLAGAANPAIEISAPADVIDKLSRALADRDIAIIARESDQADATVHFGSTTIATEVEAWLAPSTLGWRGA